MINVNEYRLYSYVKPLYVPPPPPPVGFGTISTQMTMAVPGIITFGYPIKLSIGIRSIVSAIAVLGTWATDDTGSDGKILVLSIMRDNSNKFEQLKRSMILDTLVGSNLLAVQ